MNQSILRTPIELFFTFNPMLFFVQGLNLIAGIINSLLGLVGIQANVVGF